MRELTTASGGIGPVAAVLVIAVAGATLYSGGKSIYEFGKAIGRLVVESLDDNKVGA